MAAHTAGPWRLEFQNRVRNVIKGAGPKGRTVCIVESWTTPEDAALLAAAPELAAALVGLLAFGACEREPCDCPVSRAKRALQKAGLR